MDGEKRHNPFSVGETHEPVRTSPLEVPAAIGAAAAQGADVSVETGAESAFEEQISRFLDPEVELSRDDQLSLMNGFWNRLGYKVADLGAEQASTLGKVAAAHPNWRVVPAPLLDLDGRNAIAERARAFPGSKFKPQRAALRVPSPGWTYGKLLSDPESIVRYGRTPFGLRYKTPNGGVVGREAYIDALKSAGQAVESQDGTPWVFPVMDIQMHLKKRAYDYAPSLYKSVDPLVTPESLIAIQLLHQAKGIRNRRWHVDLANEAVYKLNKEDNPRALMSVAGVDWYKRQVYLRDSGGDFSRIGMYRWSMTDQRDNFGIRRAESGL